MYELTFAGIFHNEALIDLQLRGSEGEHSDSSDGKNDISNRQRLGFTEVQLVQKLIDGVSAVIEVERLE